MNKQSTEAQLRDLAAAVIEALTVPLAKHSGDEYEAASLLRTRAAAIRGALSCVADGIAEPRFAASAIRSDITAYPVTYEPFVNESAEQPSLGVASLPSEWSVAVSA